LVVTAVVVALVGWRSSRGRGESNRRRGPNPRLFSFFVPPVGRQDQQSTDEECAGGTNRPPRLERRVEPSGEVEVDRRRDHEKPDEDRRPHAKDRSDALAPHRLIKRMMASAGSPPASSRALRASSSETPAFSATSFTSSSGMAGVVVPSVFFASARSRTIGSATTVQTFCP